MRSLLSVASLALLAACGGPAVDQAVAPLLDDPYVFTDWQTWGTADGLPNPIVLGLEVTDSKVWAATEGGVAVLDRASGQWSTLPIESAPGANDGVAYKVVTAVEQDDDGHLWFGTFKGLSWYDGQTWRNFRMPDGQDPKTPEPKGLINNVVYAVTHIGPEIWVATTDGVSVFDKRSETWRSHYLNNAPMDETWCYGITSSPDKIWLAAWGSGLLEWTASEQRWQAYHDPDGSFAIDLLPDDGMLSQMAVGASHDDGVTWVATYFGVSAFDGKSWRDWDEDHGLASNFLNGVRAHGQTGWAATDKGLSGFVGDRWLTYDRVEGEGEPYGTLTISGPEGEDPQVYRMRSAIPHDFVWWVEFDSAGGVWIGTSKGVGYGTPYRAGGGL